MLNNTKCTRGSTRRLDLAFVTIANMFSRGGGLRNNVERTLLLITSGKQKICNKCSSSIMTIAPKWLEVKINTCDIFAKPVKVFCFDGVN